MHPLKPLFLVGIGAAAATAENDSACSPVTTVFVAVPNSPTTEVISVLQTSLPAEGQAAYSFSEDNGTTTWLGATPPASASLITSSQIVTLQPVPPGYDTQSTGSSTFPSTTTITETQAETRTLTIATASASAGAYTGIASHGWNSTASTTFITVQSPATGSVTIAATLPYYSGTAYPITPSGVVPHSPGSPIGYIKARDITDIIVATISGVAVSWTTTYNGTPLSSSDTSPIVVPTTGTAPQSGLESFPSSSTVSSPVQTYLSNTTATSNAAATSTSPSCGYASAGFTIDFDDLPAFSAGPGNTDIPPIFSPYHNLVFNEFFGYVPPPSDPFPPISPPQLAVYRANDSEKTGSPDGGIELPGEIGSGPWALDSAYWIDAFSAYLGCTNAGPDDCSIMVIGYQNSDFFSYITQGFTLPPCPGMKNCSLALIEFADGFRNLTGLQIMATVGTISVDWYMDNLSLGWSNNTCAAQLERSSQE